MYNEVIYEHDSCLNMKSTFVSYTYYTYSPQEMVESFINLEYFFL